jgi:hypothetical protein
MCPGLANVYWWMKTCDHSDVVLFTLRECHRSYCWYLANVVMRVSQFPDFLSHPQLIYVTKMSADKMIGGFGIRFPCTIDLTPFMSNLYELTLPHRPFWRFLTLVTAYGFFG